MPVIELKGLAELNVTLQDLAANGARKAAKAGTNAGLGVLANALKSAVNASSASPELKAAARKTIAKRLKRREGQETVGKVGFGVGRRSQKTKKAQSAHQRYMAGQGGAHNMRGVGVSSANIHWFVLGTQDRTAGAKTNRASEIRGRKHFTVPRHHTGRIRDLLGGLLGPAAAACQGEMLEAARAKCEQVLAAEAAKAKR
jgi:hypothetical protein